MPILLLVGMLCGCGGPPAAELPARPTSLLLISIDTVRADHLGCMGQPRAVTPHIDSLAAAGVLFEQAHTPVPLTLPAHTALLTGTDPLLNRVRDNGLDRLAAGIPTLAAHLRGRGYSTAAVVGSLVLDHRYGLARGFDRYDEIGSPRPGERPRLERPAGEVTDRALEWLVGQQDRERFFLWVHFFDPHQPYAPPDPWSRVFADQPYLGEIAYTDAEIGRLLDGLRRQDRLADTLVVVVGDHGEGLGDHGELTHGVLTYESTLRVPMVFAHSSLPTGVRVREPVSLIDVVPTVLSVLGEDPMTASRGQSLMAAWSQPAWRRSEPLYFESMLPLDSFGWSRLEGVIAGGHKLIDAPRVELYDLLSDPHETNNLAAESPERCASLRRELDHLRSVSRTGDDQPLAAQRGEGLTQEERARLAALGYVPGAAPRDPAGALVDPKDRIDVAEKLLALVLAHEQGRAEEARLGALEMLDEQGDCFLALAIAGLGTLARAQAMQGSGPPAEARSTLEQAVRLIERALALNDRWVDLHHRLALALEILGHEKQAEAHWLRCLELQPSYAPPHRRLGLLAEHRGESGAASQHYRRYLELERGAGRVVEDTRRRLSRLSRQSRREER